MEDIFNTPEARAQAEKSKRRALQTAATLKPSEEVYTIINGLEYLTAETIAILTQRGQEWHDTWPIGEPRYCRNDGYQFLIHTNQVAELLEKNIRTAQEVLAANRKALGKPDRAHVTVKEFCFINHLPEEETREALKRIKPDFSIK